MSYNEKLANVVSSYFDDNNTNPRKTAKKIDKVLGIPDSISYNTLYYWSKGLRERPTSANLILPQLYERADGPLKELASNLMEVLAITVAAR